MDRLENTLAGIGIGLVMIGPAVLLLLLRRWSRQWWVAIIGTAVATPPTAFLTVGGVAWALTYWRVGVGGDTAVPDEIGMSVQQYLGFTFAVCGGYGVLFACTGLGLSSPVIVLWRLAHSNSFSRFTRCGSASGAHGGGRCQDAEPGAAPDRGT